MPRAVRYDEFGGIDVLRVDEVQRPVPGSEQVLVRVKAAGINPSEGRSTFPSSWRAATCSRRPVLVRRAPSGAGTRRPPRRAGPSSDGSGAAGGVGSLAAQLARRTGATVIGLASESNHEWLKSHGVVPVAYGDGVADRIRAAAPGGVDAFIDTFGDGYVELALALGVAADRIDTIADFAAARKRGEGRRGTAAGPGGRVLAELAGLIADGHLEVPIANVYPLAQVREAYTELERRHTRGKIVLRP